MERRNHGAALMSPSFCAGFKTYRDKQHQIHFAGKENVHLTIQLWDAAANAGKGVKLAVGDISLAWSSWQQGAVNRQSVTLQSSSNNEVQLLLMFCHR